MKRFYLFLVVIGFLYLSSSVHAQTIGVGLGWSTTEETTIEGQKKCIEYKLYNPFDVTVQGYLDVSGNLVNLTPYNNEYWELEAANKRYRELQNEYVKLTSELKELRKDPVKNLEQISDVENRIGELDTEKTKVKSKQSDLGERIGKLKDAKPIEVPAKTFSENAIPQQLCFDIPRLERYDCKIGKYFCSGCKSKLFYGEVSAKYLRPSVERTGTGSGVGSSFAVPLTIIVRCSEPTFPIKTVAIILIIAVIIIIAIIAMWIYKIKGGGKGRTGMRKSHI